MGWLQTTLLVVHLMQRVHGIRGRPQKAKPADYLIQIYEVLKTGMQWNRLKGPLHWSTYYKKFRQWTEWGVFENAFRLIQRIFKSQHYLVAKDYRTLFVDASHIRNMRGTDQVGVNYSDRGRKGTKVTSIVTGRGIPLGLTLSSSNVNDTQLVEPLIDNLTINITGSCIVADKGYLSQQLKTRLSRQREIELIYPPRSNQRIRNTATEEQLLRKRNIIEHLWSWQQNNRRIIFRYEKRLSSYSSLYYLGLMVICNQKIDF